MDSAGFAELVEQPLGPTPRFGVEAGVRRLDRSNVPLRSLVGPPPERERDPERVLSALERLLVAPEGSKRVRQLSVGVLDGGMHVATELPPHLERAAMERSVHQQVAFYGSTPSYRTFLAYHGFEDVAKQLNALMRAGELAKMPGAVPDALLDEVAVSGRFDELRAKIEARYAGGLAHRASLYTAVPRDADESAWKTLTG